MSLDRVLRISGARKRFGDIDALSDLSLEVGDREWLGLLGPNGAGKSTLMHAIAGLIRLDAGTIELFGEVFGPLPRRRLTGSSEIGLIPQEIALYPALTVEENLRFFAKVHGVVDSEVSRRVVWALEWTGLGERSRTAVEQLSGGMQRRLNIACGVLHEPRLVLLDEPTVGVDPQGRLRILEMLEQLRSKGATLIQSTHGLAEIEPLCDRMLIMDHGAVIEAGTLDELVDRCLGGWATLELGLDRSAGALLPVAGLELRGTELRGTLDNVAGELPGILARVADLGLEIRHLRVDRPGLEAVFSHLTGRELRE